MSENRKDEHDPTEGSKIVVSVAEAGIRLRKVATYRGPEAVAITFTIRSRLERRCELRVIDTIPAALRANQVEFHPNYDPVNWSRDGDSVVYETLIPASANRTTAYGVVIESRDQLELFDSEPVIEIDRLSGEPLDGESFTFDSAESDELFDTASPTESNAQNSLRGDSKSAKELRATTYHSEPAYEATADHEDDSLIETFVTELHRRELSESERRTLRDALDLDQGPRHDHKIDSLQDQIETLREEIEAADNRSRRLERLDTELTSLGETVATNYEDLSDELAELRQVVKREIEWRSQLRESLSFEPDIE